MRPQPVNIGAVACFDMVSWRRPRAASLRSGLREPGAGDECVGLGAGAGVDDAHAGRDLECGGDSHLRADAGDLGPQTQTIRIVVAEALLQAATRQASDP